MRYELRGGSVNAAIGRVDAPLLVVMTSMPTEGMFAWFWKLTCQECKIDKTDIRVVFILDEEPAGANGGILKPQLRASWHRFEREIKESTPRVVLPMGSTALYYLTGIDTPGIFQTRGYVLTKKYFKTFEKEVWKQYAEYKTTNKVKGYQIGDPRCKWMVEALPCLLGPEFPGTVIPIYQLDHIRTEGFANKPAVKEDICRARRAMTGSLAMVDEGFEYYTDINTMSNGTVSWVADRALLQTDWREDILAIDIETHGVDNEVIDCVSFSDGYTSASLPWTQFVRDYLISFFRRDCETVYLFHNSQFDVPRLQAAGVVISQKVIDYQLFCTMFGAVILQPDLLKGLGAVATVYMDLEPWKWRWLSETNPVFYSAKDAFVTAWLGRQEIAVMKSLGVWNLAMGRGGYPGPGCMATLPTLSDMSREGIRTNRVEAEKWCHLLERKELRLQKLWAKYFPLSNPNSTQAVAKIMYGEWGLPVQKTKKDGVTTDELALIKLRAYVQSDYARQHDDGRWKSDSRCTPRFFDLVLAIRDTHKTLGTYVQPVALGTSTWVHPQYLPVSKDDIAAKQGVSKGNTCTGRLAASHPNIQNQPKKCRRLYLPDTDEMCFIEADYMSAELYVMAYMAGDKRLMEDLKGDKSIGDDMHSRNGRRFGVPRPTAKNVTYACQYLAGPAKVSEMILEQEHEYVDIPTCKRIMDGLTEYYADVSAYKRHLIALCDTKKYIINPFGRIRFFHDGRAPAAVDFIPQSTVADIIWCVLRKVGEMARSLGGRLITTVHDSILIQVPKACVAEAARRMRDIMEMRFDCVSPGFFIPVELKVGAPGVSWLEMEAYTLEAA
jgi:hypothetical protein